MAAGAKMKTDMEHYLDSSEYIDWKHPLVVAKAAELAENCHSDEAVAKEIWGQKKSGVRPYI
jgi:hypothetical protein